MTGGQAEAVSNEWGGALVFDQLVNQPKRSVLLVVELLGMAALLVLLAFVMWGFSVAGAFALDYTLHRALWTAKLAGTELAIIPLTAIAATKWRFAANRLQTFRASDIGPFLPLLLAATLFGLMTYLRWSWLTPLNAFGPDEFGVVRWLGTALAAAFTMIWLPLFPRITATLAGMIAGPAVFAVIGYTFLGSYMRNPGLSQLESWVGIGLFFLVAVLLVWMPVALWLSHRAWLGEVVRQGRRPLSHALWSGALMLLLTVWGTNIGEAF